MKESLTKIGSAGAAFLASLCCIGPLILVGLGFGGAGLATSLAEYRPFLMGITFILLGAAFYYTYRKREIVCEDGSCTTCRGSRKSQLSLWLIMLVAIGMLSIPYLDWNSTSAAEMSANAGLKTTTLQVNGMTCTGCETPLEIALGKLDGVTSVKASYADKEAVISFNPEQFSAAAAISKIDDLGFSASLKE
ncbi:MAG: mercuric transporter MerT family protein [Calditrichia bacterium]